MSLTPASLENSSILPGEKVSYIENDSLAPDRLHLWREIDRRPGGVGCSDFALGRIKEDLIMSLARTKIETFARYDTLPSVEAELNYLAPTSARPRTYTYDPPPGVPRTTQVYEPHKVLIHDVGPVAARISLDGEGFRLLQHCSAVHDFYDDDAIRRVYYPETERLLQDATGADRAFIFDHTVRRRIAGA